MGEQILNKKIEIARNFIIFTLIACILILIQTPNSSALELTDVQYTWMDEPIELVSNNNIVPVKLTFQYTLAESEAVNAITVDASGMQADITQQHYYTAISINPASCLKRNETYTCKVTKNSNNRYLSMKINDPSVTTKITFTLSNGTTIEKEDTKTFTIDNTRPKVTSIKSENCDSDDQCYASAGRQNKFIIDMEDSQASFERKIVAFEVGSEVSYVSDCEGLSCYGYAVPVCSVATPLSLRVVPFGGISSQDDAGNPIVQDLPFSVMCDPDLPQIIDDSLTVISTSGEDVLTTNGQATISLQVKESTSPSLIIEVNASLIGGPNATGNCVETETPEVYDCAVSFQPSDAVAGKFNLPVKVTDLAGNTATATASLTLYESSDKASVNAWTQKSVTQSNNILDAINMIYERDVMIYLELTPRISGAELVSATSGGNCVAAIEGTTGATGDISELRVTKVDKEKNRLHLTATIAGHGGASQRYANYGRLTYNCPINIISKAGSYYYTVPEQENITIDFQIINDKTFGTYVKDEINSTQEGLESVKSIVDTYYSTFSTVESACMAISKTKNVVAGMGGILSAMGIAANTLGIVDMGSSKLAGENFAGAIGGIDDATNKISAIVGPMCQLFTCESDFQNTLKSTWNDWGLSNDLAQIGGYDNSADVLNPYKSMYVAMTSFCAPAIIYHMQIDMGIDCQYMECMSKGVGSIGVSPTTCSEQKEYSECVYTWNNVLNFIPLTALFKDVTGRLADIVEDPVTFFGTTGITAACKFMPELVGKGNCYTVKGITAGLESMNTVQSMFLPQRKAGDACDYVVDRVDPRTKVWKADESTATRMINQKDGKYSTQIKRISKVNEEQSKLVGECVAGVCRNEDLGKLRFTVSDVAPGEAVTDDKVLVYQDNKYLGTISQILNGADKYSAEMKKYNSAFKAYKVQEEVFVLEEQLSLYRAKLPTVVSDSDNQQLLIDIGITNAELTRQQNTLDQIKGEYLEGAYVNELMSQEDLNKLSDLNQMIADMNSGIFNKPSTNDINKKLILNDGSLNEETKANYEKMRDEMAEYQKMIYNNLINEYGEDLVNGADGKPGLYEMMGKLSDARQNRERYNWQSDIYNLNSKINEKEVELKKIQEDIAQSTRDFHDGKNDGSEMSKLGEKFDELNADLKKDQNNFQALETKYEEKYGGEEIELKFDEDDTPISGDELAQELEYDIAYVESYGNWHQTIKTFWGIGSDIQTLKNTFQADWGKFGAHTFMGKISSGLRDMSNIEQEICASPNFNDGVSDDRGSAVINVGHQGSFETGAFISGRSAVKTLDDETTTNQYWISGMVGSKKKEGLKFKVILKGASNKDITKEIPSLGTTPFVMRLGQMISFGGTNTFYFEDAAQYDEVCIDFMRGGDSLRDYFDNVFGLDDGKYCQKLVVEENVN